MQMLIIKVLVTIDKYKGLFLQKKTQQKLVIKLPKQEKKTIRNYLFIKKTKMKKKVSLKKKST